MGVLWASVRESVLRLLACHLQPERVRTKINFLVPDQLSSIAYTRRTEVFVIVPKFKDASPRLLREINLALHAIVKTQPNAEVIQNLQIGNLLHCSLLQNVPQRGPAVNQSFGSHNF